MTNYYTELLLLFYGITLTHIGLVTKRYTKIITPYFLNGETNWNPDIDRLKMLFTIVFLFTPVILMKYFIQYGSGNTVINYSGLGIIISFTLFCLWFDLKKIRTMKSSKTITKNKPETLHNPLDKIKNSITSLNSKLDKNIEKTSTNSNQIMNIQSQVISNSNKNTLDLEYLKKDFVEIKNKIEPKKRKSSVRDKKIKEVGLGFEILKKDLEKFSNYDRNKKILKFKKYNMHELQAYQVLLLFFKNNYDIPQDKTNNIIYTFFNSYFKIETKMKKNNWTQFSKKHLDNVENFGLYSDLIFYVKKKNSTVD